MRKQFEWQVEKNKNGQYKHDQLLNALVTLTQYYKTPCSPRTLTANLPLEDNKLTPSLFARAAERAQLDSKIYDISLQSIKKATLPVVLLLTDGSVAIMVDRHEGFSRILLMETGQGLNSLPDVELEELYSGVTIFVKPTYKFSQRHGNKVSKHLKRLNCIG